MGRGSPVKLVVGIVAYPTDGEVYNLSVDFATETYNMADECHALVVDGLVVFGQFVLFLVDCLGPSPLNGVAGSDFHRSKVPKDLYGSGSHGLDEVSV